MDANPHTKYKVAIVEDDPAIRALYQTKFELSGFQVKTAMNGIEGLELIRTFNPDLLLLDIRMPEMNGDEMLKLVREHEWGRDVRVLVLTNISRDEAPQVLRLLNVDRYIVKAHHTPAQILEIVKEILRIK